jgi:hypothetical protein
VFVAAATLVLIPRRQPPQEDTAPAVLPHTAAVTHDTGRPRSTTGAVRTVRAAKRQSVAASDAPESDVAPTAVATAAPPAPDVTRVPSSEVASAQDTRAITISGCLVRNDAGFRLKDTEGDTAPRSRSWKSGFLKRTNRSVDVIDARNQFDLADHVGERVNATGTLVDGDMQLRSLRRAAGSCA